MIPDKVEFSPKSNKWNKEKHSLMLKAITHNKDMLLIFTHLTTQQVCQAEIIDERRNMQTHAGDYRTRLSCAQRAKNHSIKYLYH